MGRFILFVMTSPSFEDVLEKIESYPEGIIQGEGLTKEERGVLDPRDTWVVSYVNELPFKDLVRIGNCFRAIDMKHYMRLQKGWFETEKFLLGGRINRNPEDLELLNDAQEHRNMERYRLCYVLEYPHKVAFNMHYYSNLENRYDADVFLAEASRIHRIPFPYFELIWCNTLLNSSDKNEFCQQA
jgi:hypothetical protein